MRSTWNYAFDSLRMLGTLAIILLHVISGWRDDGIFGHTYYEITSIRFILDHEIIALLTRWAVPCFFMMSGALLLNPQKTISYSTVKRYIIRIMLALIIFGYCFSVMELFVDDRVISASLFIVAAEKLLEGNTWSHLWYLYTLIGLYCILPILKTWVGKVNDRDYKIGLAILLIVCSVIPSINILFKQDFTTFGLPASLGAASVLFLLGDMIYSNKLMVLQGRLRFLLLLVSGMAILLLEWYGFYKYTYFTSHIYIWVIIFSACIFSYATTSKKIVKLGKMRIVQFFSRHSFCIYIIHPVPLNFMYKAFHIFPNQFSPIIGEFFIWSIILAVAVIGSMILHRIPGIKKIL